MMIGMGSWVRSMGYDMLPTKQGPECFKNLVHSKSNPALSDVPDHFLYIKEFLLLHLFLHFTVQRSG
jgi:hypothetical protein